MRTQDCRTARIGHSSSGYERLIGPDSRSGLGRTGGERQGQSLSLGRVLGQIDRQQIGRADEGGRHLPRVSRPTWSGNEGIELGDVCVRRRLGGIDEDLQARLAKDVKSRPHAESRARRSWIVPSIDHESCLHEALLDAAGCPETGARTRRPGRPRGRRLRRDGITLRRRR